MYLENLINKIKLPFRKDKELYQRLYTILGFYPKNIALYKQALSHKSLAIKGKNGKNENNERLEFLGDAILDAIVGDIVFNRFEGKSEGFLTNTRSKLVQREMLGKLAVEVGIDKLVRYNGLSQTPHSFMAGNAFEALVGAIYLDYGYERCMRFMKQRILDRIVDVDKVAYKEVNFKSKLLEWSQKNRIRLLFEDSEQRKANGNSSSFYCEVIIEGVMSGSGKGYSKKEAQQNAAKDALFQLKKQKGFEQRIFDAKGKRTAMEEQPQALLPEIPDELLKPSKEERPMPKTEKKVEEKAEKAVEKKTDNSTPKDKKNNQPVEKRTERKGKSKGAKNNKENGEASEKKPALAEEKTQETPVTEEVEKVSLQETSEGEIKRKPRRRHSRKPQTLKPQTEESGSENK